MLGAPVRRALAFVNDLRLGRKCLSGTNALAYFDTVEENVFFYVCTSLMNDSEEILAIKF
jgi:hypothetical protein